MNAVLVVAAFAAVVGLCLMSEVCRGAVWSSLAELRLVASDDLDGSLPAFVCGEDAGGDGRRGSLSADDFTCGWFSLSVSLFVLQVVLCVVIACGSRAVIALRGPVAPSSPLNSAPLQSELVAHVCNQVEQCASSATTPDDAVPAAPDCGADVVFAARRHISSSAGQLPADAGSELGLAAVAGPPLVGAAASAAGRAARTGVAGSWAEVDSLAFGSGGGRRVEAARRRARALLRAEVRAEEDALEACELERAMVESAVDTVRSSCADFDGAIAASLGGEGEGGGGVGSARPSGLFSGPDGFVRAWKSPVGWVAPPVWSREPGLDPAGGDRWGVKVRLRMPQSGSLLVWVRVAPVRSCW